MEDLGRFMIEIRRVFGPSNEESTAIQVVQYLTQKKSAAEYSVQFQEYADKIGQDDTILITYYRRGLKKNIKEELIQTGVRVENLDNLVKEAISINNKQHDFTMENRYNGGIRGYSSINSRNSFGGGY